MPMPPPPASTERRDRQTFHEMGQILRALESRGPQQAEDLSALVGGEFWEKGRFERAVALAVADGLALLDAEGRVAASG